MYNLIDVKPCSLLVHGPSKLLVDAYHWHEPDLGIIASYTPTPFDVKDHFGIFRGVDMVEAFAQACNASCGLFLESTKLNCSFDELKNVFTPLFLSIGQVNFMGFLEEGETMISIGVIKQFKFRQMICDGRIYKVPSGFQLNTYFNNYTSAQFLANDFPEDFVQIAELTSIVGKVIKKEKMLK